jgi:hypothetical protein
MLDLYSLILLGFSNQRPPNGRSAVIDMKSRQKKAQGWYQIGDDQARS